MESTRNKKDQVLHFMDGGGEMGALTRSYDWNASSLGPPESWPVHLKVTLSIILSSRFPMFLWWGPQMIQFYNDAYRPSLGRDGKHPTALGQQAFDCWPEIWDIIYPLIQQVQTTGEPTWSEDQLVPIYRNGKIEDVYWTFGYSAIKSPAGDVDGVLVVCHETTRNVKANASVKKSEAQIRSMVESAPFPIAVYTGSDMRIQLANDAMMNFWGKGKQVIGKRYRDILPEHESQQIYEQLDSVFTSGIPYHANNKKLLTEVDGGLRSAYLNYSLTPLFDSPGNVYGIMNTAADVTDLNLIKQQLERSERNLRNTILQAPVAMCILIGPAYVLELANDLMYALWGKPARELLGKPIFEGLPEARNQGFESILDNVYRNGEAYSAHAVPLTLPREGRSKTIYINYLYTPYRETDGAITGILAAAVDVTDQVVARNQIREVVEERTRELAEANDTLRKSNAELEQFAYIASHDLQEPLRKISIFAQMLQHSLPQLDERLQNYFNKITSAAGRMTTLIRDVLTYSQVAKEKAGFETVDLNAILEGTLADFEVLIEQRSAKIESGKLPVVEAIPLQMAQIFANLISNSIKYGQKDTPPHIRIKCATLASEDLYAMGLAHDKRYYSLEFIDNGIGFKQEYAEQIFNIFQRLHRKTDYAGTGIGLAICRKIAENHQGRIFARGAPEGGAVFTLLLPEHQK